MSGSASSGLGPNSGTDAMGQSTKSLRDSPLRGAGELIKLNPLAPSKATSARSLTWIEEATQREMQGSSLIDI